MQTSTAMAKPATCSFFSHTLCFCLSLIFLLFQLCSQLAVSHSTVEFLPGFQGTLPFELETGYVGVDESDDVQLFYYFVKSETNPLEDPLIFWLSGGPGCSSVSGLLYEIGPVNFEIVEYNGSLPRLVLNPNSWTKVSSIIFLDLPVGTGFSYATTSHAYQSGDLQSTLYACQFLRKWLAEHPEFYSNPLYVGGDSYSGLTIPRIMQLLSNGIKFLSLLDNANNEEGVEPLINLKGYLLGNPVTDPILEGNFAIPFAHGMGLISDELYESLKGSCKGEYQVIDPDNKLCLNHIQAYRECISRIDLAQILEPLCNFASPKPQEIIYRRRYLKEKFTEFPLSQPPPLPPIACRTYAYVLSYYWINEEDVRKALHIREESIGEWQRCNYGLPYAGEIINSYQYHVNLSSKGYRTLIYSGDHDMLVPFFATQAWIRSLNYSIIEDWRSWFVQGQVAGYTRTYSNQMTFATIKGGGHTAPEYRPEECCAMFKRWISHQPL